MDSILGPHLSMFDSCREWGQGLGCRDGWFPDSDAQGTCSYLANCLYEYCYIFTKKKKGKNVHFISPYLLQRLFSVTSLWFTLKYVDDT